MNEEMNEVMMDENVETVDAEIYDDCDHQAGIFKLAIGAAIGAAGAGVAYLIGKKAIPAVKRGFAAAKGAAGEKVEKVKTKARDKKYVKAEVIEPEAEDTDE